MEDKRENEQITEEAAEEVSGGSVSHIRPPRYIWHCYSCGAGDTLNPLEDIPPCPKCGSNDVIRVKQS